MGWRGGGGGHMSVKILLLCQLSVVGKSQLIFLSLVGKCFLVLSVVSNIFSPFVTSP